ncbi:hypothetical protein ACQP00_23325 [Dactylosporangium sp. CS-047395]|uniref:hypothetical protein n=1 Tax=Dactylosporangium sp. CS-047395 TaxID=3239936 RepID=UPI003D917049
MNARTRRSLTIVGMGVVAGAALGLSGTAASAASTASPTDIAAVPVKSSTHTAPAAQTDTRGNDGNHRGNDGNNRGNDDGNDGNNRGNQHDNRGNDRGNQQDNRGNDGNGRGNDGNGRDGRHDHDVRQVQQRTRTFTVDHYRSKHACQSDARTGVRRGYWDKATCTQVGHRHLYELRATVYQGHHRAPAGHRV